MFLKANAVRGVLLVLTLNSSASLAASFEQADALFARRGEGRALIEQARAEYKRQLQNASPEHTVYAVEQLGKLAYYEGELVLPGGDGPDAARAAVFQDCRDFVENIAQIDSARTEYHYWKLLCTAFWVRHASRMAALFQVGQIRSYFDSVVGDDLELRPELALDSRYMGGGLLRVMAGILRDDLSSMLRSSLPDREQGLALIERALASPAFPGDVHAGDMWYVNFRGRGDLLIRLGRSDEAREVLTSAIAEIEDLQSAGELPQGLEPETMGEMNVMRNLLGSL